MKNLKSISLIAIVMLISSCLGDKGTINVSEIGDNSFINSNFKSNIINYSKGMSGCDKLNANTIAKLYNVSPDLVLIEDPTKSDRYKNPDPVCGLYIKIGENDYQWLRGSIGVQREIGKNETMGEIAEAAGNGENWEEAWSLKKAMSKSSEWIPNMGKAALWNSRRQMLEIKFEGYTLTITPIKNILNVEEKAKNRDYKKIAIAIAKAAGYIN